MLVAISICCTLTLSHRQTSAAVCSMCTWSAALVLVSFSGLPAVVFSGPAAKSKAEADGIGQSFGSGGHSSLGGHDVVPSFVSHDEGHHGGQGGSSYGSHGDCRTEYKEVCHTTYEPECRNSYKDFCLTVHEQQCAPYTEKQCLDVPEVQCGDVEDRACGVVETTQVRKETK